MTLQGRYLKLPSGVIIDRVGQVYIIGTEDPTPFKIIPFVNIVYVESAKKYQVTFPMVEDSLKFLRNMGYDVYGAEPIRHKYSIPLIEGVHHPRPHQITTSSFFAENPRGYCFNEMRTGKTASAIIATDYINKHIERGGTLILCTVTNMDGVWLKEINGLLPNATVSIVHGANGKKENAVSVEADYYICNYDGVKTLKKELRALIEKGFINKVIVDELTHYANPSSALWKAANYVINGIGRGKDPDGRPCKYAWGLTGSPGKDPIKVYGQAKLITPKNMVMSLDSWKRSTMFQPNPFQVHRWEMLPTALGSIEKVLSPSIRFEKKDIFDLPIPERAFIFSPVSAEQTRLIKSVSDDYVLTYGVDDSRDPVIVSNKATMITKVLQICTGAVYLQDTIVRIDIESRLNDLLKIINETKRKVIIFCAYTETIGVVTEFLTKNKIGYVESHGKVTGAKRAKQLKSFQESPKVKVLVAHPQTTAYGTELSEADTMLFFGPPRSGYTAFVQAVERMSSLKQEATKLRILFFYGCQEEKVAFDSILAGESAGRTINKIFDEVTKNSSV